MILVVDNYDSFTYNLVQELAELSDAQIRVLRNDVASADEMLALAPQAVVISPGPGIPQRAGVTMELIERARRVPLLGICLGHQALAAVHGARVARAPEPVHGKTSEIHHAGSGLFAGLPEPLTATRYHSLVVERDSVPAELEITAWTDDGLVMGLADRERPHFGVQFHPESYLTRDGMRLLAGFLRLAGVAAGGGGAG
ncbi:MAG: aminodeoxychorismate/anthranilate synthase component II [Acidobacteria bacterium]|nr:aminodeoxychorismate/anthranilate synthase component II [Acidobacteriota bacterium]